MIASAPKTLPILAPIISTRPRVSFETGCCDVDGIADVVVLGESNKVDVAEADKDGTGDFVKTPVASAVTITDKGGTVVTRVAFSPNVCGDA